MQLSELISKQVIAKDGSALGYVKNVYLNKSKSAISALCCVDGDEEEFFVPARGVISIGEFVTVGGSRCQAPAGLPCPVGKAVYSARGGYLGMAREFTIGEEGAYLTAEKEGDKTRYPAERLVWEEIVLALPPQKSQIKQTGGNQRQTEQESLYESNLLGKRVKRELKDGELTLIRAGERVTPAIIREAAKRNRLLELSAAVWEQ